MAERPTLNQLWLDALHRHSRPDLLWAKREGRWQAISSSTFLRRAASLAESLQELGVGPGDRVAIFSENRPEWHIADLAALGLGAIDVPIYFSESVERLDYILKHSEAKVCFVSTAEQFGKVSLLWNELPALEHVILFGEAVAGEAGAGRRVLSWSALVRDDAPAEVVGAFEATARALKSDDVATLIYTSGTTGVPKGVLLTQDNFASNVLALEKLAEASPNQRALSMLPLCHIYERTNAYHYFHHGVPIAYCDSFEKVADYLLEARPTVMAAVPRFFEKVYAGIQKKVAAKPAPLRRVFEWAVSVGREALPYRLDLKPLPFGLRLRFALAHLLVCRKIRAQLGGRVQHFVSGGAPLSRGINEYLHSLGLTIYEGYGLTETSPVISVNYPGHCKLGTVGPPLDGVEVKIAEDGEVLCRGPLIMKGYYKMEAETREALRDGWFHTGDIGELDPEGFLRITDRKKDLIKTAGGKYVAPQPIENELKRSPFIQNVVLVGDRQRFVAALLVPNFATVEHYAAEQGIAAATRAELLGQRKVRALFDAEIEKVNAHLAQFERVKRYALLEHEFSFDGGQLTYTQKVRRRQVEEQYKDLLQKLYAEEARPA
jgi:long-chain acyl-CoA synthetase